MSLNKICIAQHTHSYSNGSYKGADTDMYSRSTILVVDDEEIVKKKLKDAINLRKKFI